jgi:hypothetical protein
MDEFDYDYVEPEDFVIRVRPMITHDRQWTGEIDLSVITLPENELNDDDYGSLIHFCKMMCASVPVMETNEDIRDLIHEYVTKKFDIEYEVELEDKVVSKEGNVVTIDFKTKTEGSA